MGTDALAGVVAEAVRRGLDVVRGSRPGEVLAGFALLTDDDLRSLGAVGCTREMVAAHEPGWLFEPNEWPDDGVADEVLAGAGRMLWERADAAGDDVSFERHVRGSFRVLVDALKHLRDDGVVGEDVFLVALSTDPGELLAALEAEAVRELNPGR